MNGNGFPMCSLYVPQVPNGFSICSPSFQCVSIMFYKFPMCFHYVLQVPNVFPLCSLSSQCVPIMFPWNSQWVPNMFPKFPMCSHYVPFKFPICSFQFPNGFPLCSFQVPICSPSSQCVPQHVLNRASLLSHMLWQTLSAFHL